MSITLSAKTFFFQSRTEAHETFTTLTLEYTLFMAVNLIPYTKTWSDNIGYVIILGCELFISKTMAHEILLLTIMNPLKRPKADTSYA